MGIATRRGVLSSPKVPAASDLVPVFVDTELTSGLSVPAVGRNLMPAFVDIELTSGLPAPTVGRNLIPAYVDTELTSGL